MDNDILEREGFDLEELEKYVEQPSYRLQVLKRQKLDTRPRRPISELDPNCDKITGFKITATAAVISGLIVSQGHCIAVIMLVIWLLVCSATQVVEDFVNNMERFHNDRAKRFKS